MTLIRRWWERRQAVARLRDLDLFAGCPAHQLRPVDGLLTEITVDAGRELTREGLDGVEFMVIVDGCASVHRGDEELALLGPGDFFGELALVGDGIRTATVTALTPTRMFVLGATEFRRLCEIAPSVRGRILTAAAERTHQLARAAAA